MKKTAILFPGQGSQYPGMGKLFYDKSDEVKRIYGEASEVLQYDLARHSFEGSLNALNDISDTRYAQPAILVASYAAYRYYMDNMGSLGRPSFLAGHSVGEITALVCAGTFHFSDAVRLLARRGELMSRVSATRGGTMAAIKDFYWRYTEDICRQLSTATQLVSVAAYNSDLQTVIAGHPAAIEAVGRSCAEKGGIFVPLNVTMAAHCAYMMDIQEEYANLLRTMEIRPPQAIVFSCLTGQPYTSVAEILQCMIDQLVYPVQWNKILREMKRKDAGIFIETGPGSALGKFIEARDGKVISLEKTPIDKLKAELGQQVKFIPTPLTKCLALMVSIPNLNADQQEYADIFIKYYREVQSLQDTLETEERLPDMQEIRQAIQWFGQACSGKRIPSALMTTLKNEMVRDFPYTLEFFDNHPTRSTIQHEEII